MTIKIVNCYKEWMNCEIENFEDVYLITVDVVSGDEILKVLYKDGKMEVFDSDTHSRCTDYNDGTEIVYMPGVINLLEDQKWLNRKDSYDY